MRRRFRSRERAPPTRCARRSSWRARRRPRFRSGYDMISRRRLLLSSLFGASSLGLRALATGLPASFLANPRKALADVWPGVASADAAQYVIFSTSGTGDPINANCPGTYEDAAIVHSTDPVMAPKAL